MSETLFVTCPWCNTRQKMELSGIYHLQTTEDFHEFLCRSCGRPFTIDKDLFPSTIRSLYMDNK